MLPLLALLQSSATRFAPSPLSSLYRAANLTLASPLEVYHYSLFLLSLSQLSGKPVLDCPAEQAQLSCPALVERLNQTYRLSDSQSFCIAQRMRRQCGQNQLLGLDSPRKDKDQTLCAVCIVYFQVAQNYLKVNGAKAEALIDKKVCQELDDVLKTGCQAFVHYLGPVIRYYLEKKVGPDDICLQLHVCDKKQCRIRNKTGQEVPPLQPVLDVVHKFNPWAWVKHIFVDNFGDKHFPPFDVDQDRFSDIPTFRGYNWRGVDCDQNNKMIYPGRKAGDNRIDHDCNGIFGVDAKGVSFEDKFCKDSVRLGVGVVGDSAGAHFSIPSKYMNVSEMQKGSFKDLLPRLANQFDIPHESGYTGYVNNPERHSVYKYLRNHNLCINNDYQNIGVNGGSSGNSKDNMAALARKPDLDHPMLMFFELIGNDVCGKSLEHITKEQFKANILKLWKQLDDTLPKGSHLWVFGLVDGRVLYDNLYNITHPLGVKYPVVYDLLNCLKISPCFGFLNSNQSNRDYTANLAMTLNEGYRELLAENHTFTNFDIVYYDFPTVEIIERRVEEGGDPTQLIEKCDGFHPSGLYHSYLADWIWAKIKAEHPHWVGEANPHNEEIKKVFKIPDFL